MQEHCGHYNLKEEIEDGLQDGCPVGLEFDQLLGLYFYAPYPLSHFAGAPCHFVVLVTFGTSLQRLAQLDEPIVADERAGIRVTVAVQACLDLVSDEQWAL